MSVRAVVSKLVTASISSPLREAGFRKDALTFERRRGEVTQLVNVQVSHGGGTFYVNVGLISDAIEALGGNKTGSLVIGKHTVNYGARLESLVPGLPDEWDPARPETSEKLRAAILAILPKLDAIDGPRALLAELDLEAGFGKVLRAQLRWITDDRTGARADLEAVAREFSDRRGCTVDQLAARAGIAAVLG